MHSAHSASLRPAQQDSSVDRNIKVASNVLGPATAGLLEVAVFHPIDTVAKRLMSYQHRVVLPSATLAHQLAHTNAIVFRQRQKDPFFQRFASLYQGVDYALLYKVAQRIYKFGGQPLAYHLLSKSVETHLPSVPLPQDASNTKQHRIYTTRIRRRKITLEAIAGAMVGVGEVILSPLDLLKIKSQTNMAAMEGHTLWSLIKTENVNLYRGANWAIMRNIPGSMALFGASSATKYFGFNLDGLDETGKVIAEYKRPTLFQLLTSSAVGAVCSLLVSSPFDVIKTRVQNRNFESKVRGFDVLKELVRNEGAAALYRGISPKILTVGPKLMLSYAISQYLTMQYAQGLHHVVNGKNSNSK